MTSADAMPSETSNSKRVLLSRSVSDVEVTVAVEVIWFTATARRGLRGLCRSRHRR